MELYQEKEQALQPAEFDSYRILQQASYHDLSVQ
jgi:hypothetical protein